MKRHRGRNRYISDGADVVHRTIHAGIADFGALNQLLGQRVTKGDGTETQERTVLDVVAAVVADGFLIVARNVPHQVAAVLTGIQFCQTRQTCTLLAGKRVNEHETVRHVADRVLICFVGTYKALRTHVKHIVAHGEVHKDVQVRSPYR